MLTLALLYFQSPFLRNSNNDFWGLGKVIVKRNNAVNETIMPMYVFGKKVDEFV